MFGVESELVWVELRGVGRMIVVCKPRWYVNVRDMESLVCCNVLNNSGITRWRCSCSLALLLY